MKHLVRLLAVASFLVAPESLAQAGAPRIPDSGEPTEDVRMRNAMSQSELKRLAEMLDQWNRVEGKSALSPREVKRRVGQMLEVLAIPCQIVDAALRGRETGESSPVLYEASCADGMGYLLSLAGDSLSGVSCLAGEPSSTAVCTLPANADRKLVAEAVLRGKSVSCKVRELKWLGTDADNFDHVEVACGESTGYVVRAPRPGQGQDNGKSGELKVMSCADAGVSGIRCALGAPPPAADGDAGNARPTLEWFKDAIARNGLSCQTKRARIIGRESIKRRYVVEFECVDRPEGLIAIVPAAGDTVNPFESMNCTAAVSRGIECQFVPGGPNTGD
jgi:hypothetical protein